MDYSPFALSQEESDALEQILGDLDVTDSAYINQAPVALETGPAANSPWPAQQQQQQQLPLLTGLDQQPAPPPRPNPDLGASPSRPRRAYVEIAPASPPLTAAPKRPPPLPLLDSSEGTTTLADRPTTSTCSTSDYIEHRRKVRRKETNRAAQRAFRLRKEETIRDGVARLQELEDEVTRLRSKNGDLSEAIEELQAEMRKLQVENAALEASGSPPPSDNEAWSPSVTGGPMPRASMETERIGNRLGLHNNLDQ